MTTAQNNAVTGQAISPEALDRLFREARTFRQRLPHPVPEELLTELYALCRMGSTSANSSPGRFVFILTPEAKERLLPTLHPGNVKKTRTAPATVIIANDMEFYEKMPRQVAGRDVRLLFAGNRTLIEETAFRNATLQGAYLMMAARALGLDYGPMSGFDAEKVNREFSRMASGRSISSATLDMVINPICRPGPAPGIRRGRPDYLIGVAPKVTCAAGACLPGQSAAVSVMPGVVFSGAINGHFRACSTKTGEILWDPDTQRDYDTVNKVPAKGGPCTAGPAIANGMVFTNSGYGSDGGIPGNVLLAFSVDGR